jgi:O-antigen chain-terminating methyltransferase
VTDEELSAAIRQVQERARARAPQGRLGLEGVEAPDLMPMVQARDAAQAKVAAIGTVNPRPPGLVNDAVQGAKRAVARALNWHVREQVEFNRAAMACVEASIAAMSSMSRSLAALAAHQSADVAAGAELARRLEDLRELCERQIAALGAELGAQQQAFAAQAEQLRLQQMQDALAWREQQDVALEEIYHRLEARAHAAEQRAAAAEERLSQTAAALEAAYQRRLESQEASFRDLARAQHRDFQQALERVSADVQQRLWADLARVREEFESLIHRELRLLRRRENLPAPAAAAAARQVAAAEGIDWLLFAERFRGSEERVRAQQERYVERFAGTQGEIFDLGCGRGEFLEALRDAGLSGVGIDANPECTAVCAAKGLRAECADILTYLESQPDASIAGVHCAHVIEHLEPARVNSLIRLLGVKLRAGAWVAIETPNPECLVIFATYFYADPTHTRPVPAALLRFYLEEAGFGSITVERIHPATDLLPAIAELSAALREALFGGLDYAIFGRKL